MRTNQLGTIPHYVQNTAHRQNSDVRIFVYYLLLALVIMSNYGCALIVQAAVCAAGYALLERKNKPNKRSHGGRVAIRLA